MNTIIIISISIIIVICLLVSITTNYWLYGQMMFGTTTEHEYIGLWNRCLHTNDGIKCVNTSDLGKIKNLQLIRFFSSGSLILMITSLFFIKNKFYSVLCIGLSGIFSLLSCIFWRIDPAIKYALDKEIQIENKDISKIGYSFYMGIIAGIVAIILSILVQFKLHTITTINYTEL